MKLIWGAWLLTRVTSMAQGLGLLCMWSTFLLLGWALEVTIAKPHVTFTKRRKNQQALCDAGWHRATSLHGDGAALPGAGAGKGRRDCDGGSRGDSNADPVPSELQILIWALAGIIRRLHCWHASTRPRGRCQARNHCHHVPQWSCRLRPAPARTAGLGLTAAWKSKRCGMLR